MSPFRVFGSPLVAGALVFSISGCSPDDDPKPSAPPSTYTFQSRFQDASSVNYSGQTARQVLLGDLSGYIAGLSASIDAAAFLPAAGDTLAALNSYYDGGTDALATEPLLLTTTPPTLQATYGAIAAGKNLRGKIAGSEPLVEHKDWSTEFSGWSDPTIAALGGSITSPDGLVQAFFHQIDASAAARANGSQRLGPAGEVLPVEVTTDGIHLEEIVQKFLSGAVFFSQASDDYLDDGPAGEGLMSDNGAAEQGEAFTVLEHAWDEGFGYFGAARDMGSYTTEELAGRGGRAEWSASHHDSSGDGNVDLTSEYNFGTAVYSARRDLTAIAATDFAATAFEAFLEGRHIITTAGGALSSEQMTSLKAARDRAIGAWESAIAATIVHYLNETLVSMGQFGTAAYVFTDHAAQWSEMKGLALALQFNPHSPLSDADFSTLNTLMGDRPVLAAAAPAAIDQYRQDLLTARGLLQTAFAFDAANMGSDDGTGGW